jgi:glucose/arabinose dehydrogenase
MAKFARGAVIAALLIGSAVSAQTVSPYSDWRQDAPGVRHHLTAAEMPPPFSDPAAANLPQTVSRPTDARLLVPKGFSVAAFATGLTTPRTMRFAPNGDLFVAESNAGRIRVLRMEQDPSHPDSSTIFADNLLMPSGIAFWPPGPDPKFVYVSTWTSVVRFPYRVGDTVARAAAETVIANLPEYGHWTRDIAFTPDGQHLFIAVGSLSNDGEGVGKAQPMPKLDTASIRAIEQRDGVGAAWGEEEGRATVLESDPEGHNVVHYANGLRNCTALAIGPDGEPWCTVDERDTLSGDMPDDFLTRLVPHGFYGWPWFYIGNHEDPKHRGERPDLAGRVIVPDVLFQAHSAPLSLAFYEGGQFPAQYHGSIFVAMHGSFDRSERTGSKVVRVLMKDGRPTGEYEDFLTGFTVSNTQVWGRPCGVTVAPDGALLVSDDVGGTIWRVSYNGGEDE